MKRLLSVLFILLFFATSSQSQMLQGIVGGLTTSGVTDPCSGGSPADPGDVICESFEPSDDGYWDTGWTLDEPGDSVITAKQSHPGSFNCTTRGTYALKIVHVSTSDANAMHNAGGSTDPAYVGAAIYVDSHSADEPNKYVDVLSLCEATETICLLQLLVYNVGGTVKWRLLHREYGDTWETTDATFALQTWYRHEIYVDVNCDAAGCIRWWINGVEQAIVDDDVRNRTSQYLYVGAWETAYNFTAYFDNVIIDDDAQPNQCN